MSNLIGNAPYQVPTNADLGDLAYQDSDYAIVGNLNIDTTLAVGSNATITGTTTIGGNATIGGNVFLSQAYSPLSTSPNVVVAKGYVDTQSIIWGM